MKAEAILSTAAKLVSGERNESHGDRRANHKNIAALWNAFLSIRREPNSPLSESDCAMMMALLKVARTQLGSHNADDHVDGAAYIAIAGEIA